MLVHNAMPSEVGWGRIGLIPPSGMSHHVLCVSARTAYEKKKMTCRTSKCVTSARTTYWGLQGGQEPPAHSK